MGIFNKALVIGALIVLLPTAHPTQFSFNGSVGDTSRHIISSATETFSDMRLLCGHQPRICTAVAGVAGAIEQKAVFGADLIQNWAEEAGFTMRPKSAPDMTATIPTERAVVTDAVFRPTLAYEPDFALAMQDG